MAEKFSKIKGLDYFLVILSTCVMCFSVNLFFEPANIVPGGFTGLAMMLNRFSKAYLPFEISTGLGTLFFNIPLLIIATKMRGFKFMAKTILGALSYSFWLMVLPRSTIAANDLAISSLAGGAIMGLGMGLILLAKGSTGGTDTLAALIQKKMPYLETASIYPVIDGIIIIVSVWVFGVLPSLYAILSVFVSGKMANWVQSGIRGHVNQAFIISMKYEEISKAIIKGMHRGATMIEGQGMYTHERRPVILCAVAKRQTAELRNLVFSIDPNAFFIISDAKDIRGQGFVPSEEEIL